MYKATIQAIVRVDNNCSVETLREALEEELGKEGVIE
jgi:hypothetical protein